MESKQRAEYLSEKLFLAAIRSVHVHRIGRPKACRTACLLYVCAISAASTPRFTDRQACCLEQAPLASRAMKRQHPATSLRADDNDPKLTLRNAGTLETQ